MARGGGDKGGGDGVDVDVDAIGGGDGGALWDIYHCFIRALLAHKIT